MPAAIAPATPADLDDALPLFAGYQRFYAGSAQPDEHNRAFLTRFLPPHDDGMLLVARDDAGRAVGFANLYWTFTSVRAREHVLMNDLFVDESARGSGASTLSWQTAVDNRVAQRLYERFEAERTIWFEYEIAVR